MSASILMGLELVSPTGPDGWSHVDKVSAYLYPDMAATELEGKVIGGGASVLAEGEDRTVYDIGYPSLEEFLGRVPEVAASAPAIPSRFMAGDATLTFLW